MSANSDFSFPTLLRDCVDHEEALDPLDAYDASDLDDPLTSPPTTPNITPPSSPAPQVLESLPSSSTGTAIPPDTRTHQKRQSHANRRKQRMKRRGSSQPYDYQARANSQSKHQGQAEAMVTSYTTNDAPAASSGYVGKNLETGWKRFVTLQELVGPRSRYGFDYKPWGGKCVIKFSP